MRWRWHVARWFGSLVGATQPIRHKHRATARPRLEVLEDRWLPSGMTFTVSNTNDNGAGSLRQAILDSNAHSTTAGSPNTIDFNMSGSGAVQTIHVGDNSGGGGTLNQALPALTQPVLIDGYSEPLASPNSAASGDNAKVLIELNGSDVTLAAPDTSNTSLSGLDVSGGGATIRGLSVGGFPGDGILVETSSGTAITGNFIGVSPNGTTGLANAGAGVVIDAGASGNTVGGTASGARNIISDNGDGVLISDAGTSGNVVLGNYVGTDKTGAGKLANGNDGVLLQNNAAANTIGGTAAGAANVISGNFVNGVEIIFAKDNVVLGNLIGTTASGSAILGNGGDGVYVNTSSTANTIGGTATGAANVLSGNGHNGVEINSENGNMTTGNLVLGNLIGTDKTGTAKLGNGIDGVMIDSSATDNTIGGTAAGAGNLISGNTSDGVEITGSGTSNNTVQGNFVGTTKAGTAILGNAADGVLIDTSATANTIGGTAAGAGNVISGNGTNNGSLGSLNGNGVEINGSAGPVTGNVVQGNLIGTDKTGTVKLPNLWDGALIDANTASVPTGATANTIGGTTAAARNVISGNGNHGVELAGYGGVNGNAVQGNYIGTNAAGTGILGNSNDGVLIDAEPSNNTIGGTAAGAGNVISGNGGNPAYTLGNFDGNGVQIAGDFGVVSGNVVQGNFIGTDKTGTLKLPNLWDGVAITSASPGYPTGAFDNTIGGTAAGAGNIISGNDNHGVELVGPFVTGNVVQGNFIGTNKAGTGILGNAEDGVLIDASPTGNTIGGTVAGAGNVISGNGTNVAKNPYAVNGISFYDGNGIEINGSFGVCSGNAIEGNLIGTDKTGTVKLGNLFDGVLIAATGTQSYPTGAMDNTVGGTLGTAANVISGNAANGVQITGIGATANLVLGNKIGTDKTGTVGLGNITGVVIDGTATANTVGGTTTGAGNLISRNTDGVDIEDPGTSDNLVQGNLIGTNVTGLLGLGDFNEGVYVGNGATANTIGGSALGAGNVISNNQRGVEITQTGTDDNLVAGNKIGTDKNGTGNLGNFENGVFLLDGASGNTIGGTAAGSANTIAFNGVKGVVVGASPSDITTVDDSILGNSIFANASLGIDLGDNGPTPNGVNPRPFPNDGQNTPVITAVTTTSISGTLTSANGTYRVEFFASPSGSVLQGQTFLGFTDVTLTAGTKAFMATGLTIPTGTVVTTTATNVANGDTSEFFQYAQFPTSTHVTSSPAATSGQTVTLTAQVSSMMVVQSGTVTFTIQGLPGSVEVNVDSNGKATAKFVVPAGTPNGSYKIVAVYAGPTFGPSSSDPAADGTLTVHATAPLVQAAKLRGSFFGL